MERRGRSEREGREGNGRGGRGERRRGEGRGGREGKGKEGKGRGGSGGEGRGGEGRGGEGRNWRRWQSVRGVRPSAHLQQNTSERPTLAYTHTESPPHPHPQPSCTPYSTWVRLTVQRQLLSSECSRRCSLCYLPTEQQPEGGKVPWKDWTLAVQTTVEAHKHM